MTATTPAETSPPTPPAEGQTAQPRSALPVQILAVVLITLALIPVTLELGFRILPQAIPLEACRTSEVLSGAYCQWWYAYDRPMRVGYTYRPGYHFEGPFNPADPAVIGATHLTCAPPRDEAFTLVLDADSNGFLNEEPLQDHYDVVMTGDSFSQPFSQVFWYDELANRTGMSTLNLGMDGWGPLSEAEAIRLYGLDKSPRWVLFLYFEGNDLFNVEEYQRRLESGGDWRQYHLNAFPWQERFVLPHMIRYWTRQAKSPDEGPQECVYPMTVASRIHRYETVFFDVHIDMLAENRDQITGSPAWGQATQAILDIQREVEAQGGRFLLIYVPAKEHVTWGRVWDPEEINTFVARAIPLRTFQEYDAHIHDQMRLMEAFAREQDIELLNLYYPYRRETLNGQELYNYADVHWNVQGNYFAAELIARYMEENP